MKLWLRGFWLLIHKWWKRVFMMETRFHVHRPRLRWNFTDSVVVLLCTFCMILVFYGHGQVPQTTSVVLSGMKTSFHPFFLCSDLFGPCIHVCVHYGLMNSPLMARGCRWSGVCGVAVGSPLAKSCLALSVDSLVKMTRILHLRCLYPKYPICLGCGWHSRALSLSPTPWYLWFD